MSRWDRGWLLLLGLLSASLGAGGLVWGHWLHPGRRIVGAPFEGWVGEAWFPWAVAGVGAVVTLSALAWLVSQFRRRRDRAGHFNAGDAPYDAPVSVRSKPIADAVAQHGEQVAGVISAASTVTSDSPPTIELALVADSGADLAALTHRLGEQVRASLRRTLARPDAALVVRIGLKHQRSGVVDGGTLAGPSDPAAGHLPQITLPQATLPRITLPQATLSPTTPPEYPTP